MVLYYVVKVASYESSHGYIYNFILLLLLNNVSFCYMCLILISISADCVCDHVIL